MVNLGINFDVSDATNWLGKLPAQVRIRLLAGMTNAVSDLNAAVEARAPHGETGKLARSVKGRVTATKDSVIGSVTASQFYSRFIEGGINGTFAVRPYARRQGNVIAAVKGYERTVNMPPRPFMGPAYASMKARIEQQLAESVRGVADGN